MAGTRLGPARGPRPSDKRSTPTLEDLHLAVPTRRGIPRRSRGRDRAASRTPEASPVDEFPWPPARPGLPPRPAPVDRGLFPFRGPERSTDSSSIPRSSTSPPGPWAATDLRLYQTQVIGQVRRHHELRAAHAHRPEPLVASRPWGKRRGGTSKGFSTSPTSGPTTAPTHLVSVVDSDAAAHDGSLGLVMPRPGDAALSAAERGADRGAGLVSRLPVRRLSSRGAVRARAPHGARFLLSASYKIAGQGLGGLSLHAVARHLADWTVFIEGSTPGDWRSSAHPPPAISGLERTPARTRAQKRSLRALDLGPWPTELRKRGRGLR